MMLGSSLVLAGCGGGIGPVWRNAYDAVRFLTIGMPDAEITRELINNIPYASISGKVGKGPLSLLILGSYQGDDLHWLSADNATIVTRNGRIVKTSGFPENIVNTDYLGSDPIVQGLHKFSETEKFKRSIDIDKGRVYGLVIDSYFAPLRKTDITIVGLNFKTILVEEINIARTVNWQFSNYFWVDIVDGFVWKSVQHIARTFPPIEIHTLKPPYFSID